MGEALPLIQCISWQPQNLFCSPLAGQQKDSWTAGQLDNHQIDRSDISHPVAGVSYIASLQQQKLNSIAKEYFNHGKRAFTVLNLVCVGENRKK